MPSRSSMRASDADREHVAERLRTAAAEGRLLSEELEHRLERALGARTYGELDEQIRDLPGKPLVVGRPHPGLVTARTIGVAVLAVSAALAAVVVAAVAIAGLIGGWMIWLAVWILWGRHHRGGRGRGGYRHSSPRSWERSVARHPLR